MSLYRLVEDNYEEFERVYEVDPLKCPECGGTMAVISFIEKGDQVDVVVAFEDRTPQTLAEPPRP